jgi:hypothetical protein
MPAFEFIVLKPLKVGDKTLQPGEVTVDPNTWTARTLKVYLDGGYLHYGQAIPEEFEQAPAFTGAPQGYEDREPLQPRVSRPYSFDGGRSYRCRNCRRLCWIPKDLAANVEWQCHACNQQQTIMLVRDHQDPVNVSEEMYRRGLISSDPTDKQQELSHPGKVSREAICSEENCIRPKDHSGNHRNQELREWERKSSELVDVSHGVMGGSLDARAPIDPSHPVPGRR